jgi:hypothetical protein
LTGGIALPVAALANPLFFKQTTKATKKNLQPQIYAGDGGGKIIAAKRHKKRKK